MAYSQNPHREQMSQKLNPAGRVNRIIRIAVTANSRCTVGILCLLRKKLDYRSTQNNDILI